MLNLAVGSASTILFIKFLGKSKNHMMYLISFFFVSALSFSLLAIFFIFQWHFLVGLLIASVWSFGLSIVYPQITEQMLQQVRIDNFNKLNANIFFIQTSSTIVAQFAVGQLFEWWQSDVNASMCVFCGLLLLNIAMLISLHHLKAPY